MRNFQLSALVGDLETGCMHRFDDYPNKRNCQMSGEGSVKAGSNRRQISTRKDENFPQRGEDRQTEELSACGK